MPFFPSCSIDGCLKLWEPEIRYSLCPKRKKRSLQNDMKSLLQSKEFVKEKVETLLRRDEGKEATKEVLYWIEEVNDRHEEMKDLLSSLSASSCCHLLANYHNAHKVDELIRVVGRLYSERTKWDDDGELVRDKDPQISQPPTTQTPNINEQQGPWNLFLRCVAGGNADVIGNPYIEKLARGIVDTVVECFPSDDESYNLALNFVAGSLKDHWTVSPWDAAAGKLREIAASHQDQEGITTGSQVIESIVHFCYDSLSSDRLRHCLSSCALFKHSEAVCELDLIASWMGEGLLDDSANIDEAYEQGRRVIGKLRSAHLLEVSDICDFYLRMNVHVRYVASMAAGDWENRPADPEGDLQSWSAAKARRVSIREHAVGFLPGDAQALAEEARLPDDTPVCPLLVALLVGGNETITRIHDDFFRFTPQLLVLDLSKTGIVHIPRSIGLLKALRFLKLGELKIRSLPLELGNLENLRQLDLSETKELKRIFRESISKLSKLQALFLSNSGYKWSSSDNSDLKLDDLGGLTRIQHLSLTLETAALLARVRSHFAPHTTGLTLIGEDFTASDVGSAFSSLPRLEQLELNECTRMGPKLAVRSGQLERLRRLELADLPITKIAPELEKSESIKLFLPVMRHLGLWACNSLKNLTWVGYIERLELVCLQKCEGITRLIDTDGPVENTSAGDSAEGDDGGISFPRLQFLLLWELPRLSSFSWRRHPLLLPSLRTLRVKYCPNLGRLPLGPRSCKDIREIKGTTEWWNALEWDHPDIRKSFLPYFKPY